MSPFPIAFEISVGWILEISYINIPQVWDWRQKNTEYTELPNAIQVGLLFSQEDFSWQNKEKIVRKY